MKHTLHDIVLDKGSRLLAIDVPGSSSFYVNAIVRAGFGFADPAKHELPHLLEHLAFEGTRNYPEPKDLAFQMETLGISSNARTGTDIIRYYMWGGVSQYESMLELLAEQLVHPLFGKEQVRQQKVVVRQELSRLVDDDSERLTSHLLSVLYPEQPHFATDRINTLKAISRADIVDYHKRTHSCRNTCFVIAGDVGGKRLSELTNLLNSRLSGYADGQLLPYQNKITTEFARQVVSLESSNSTNQHFDVAFISQPVKAPWKQAAAMRLVSTLYNYGSGSRIYQKARQRGLSYGVSSGFSLDKNIFSEFYIIDQTSAAELLKLVELCLQELRAIVDGNFSAKELNRAKGMLYGDYATGYETPYELADWYGPEFVNRDRLLSPQQYAELIINTTKSDIVSTARKFIRSDNWVVSLVGKNVEKHWSAVGKLVTEYYN